MTETLTREPIPDETTDSRFWNARPELVTIHQYAQARRVGPWAVLGGVLARVIASTPPSLVLPPLIGGHGSLNLFIAVVATSGGGKGTSQAAAADVFAPFGAEPFPEISIGSGEGIVHAYVHREVLEKGQAPEIIQHNNSVLFSVPEVDTFAAIARRQGSTLAAEIRKVWSGEALGFQNADATRRLHVAAHAYRAALVLGTQPARAAALLDDADGGTPQRFVWLPALDPDAPDAPPELPEPIRWRPPRTDLEKGWRLLEVCDRAAEVIDNNRTATLRGDGDVLDGHALFTRLKIAAALGLLDGRASVNDQDWYLATLVMARSDATRAGIRHHIAEQARASNTAKARARAEGEIVAEQVIDNDRTTRMIKAIVRWLESAPDGLTRSEIRRKAKSAARDYIDPALDHLLEEGVITAEDLSYQGQSGMRYRLAH